MIAFEDVSKSFWTGKTRKVILDRASFRIDIGNSMGILARNGTGKTTIINMMAGLEKPDEGKVLRTSRISFPLGFMGGIQNKHSATENARYIARLYSLDPDYVESFCRWLCGLEEYFDMPVGTYSSGMRARLSFALMLALEFDIYLIDEGMPSSQVFAAAFGAEQPVAPNADERGRAQNRRVEMAPVPKTAPTPAPTLAASQAQAPSLTPQAVRATEPKAP